MVKKDPKFGATRFKKGFAFKPVSAGGYTVQWQLYEVRQMFNPLTEKWENSNFTMQTFVDWTKI